MENAFYQFFVMNISDAMENIRKQELLVTMVDKLKKVWIYDTLTGIYNRAGFQEFANQVLQEAREKKENLFFLFLDLDCLKKINDEYGHDSGDQMIRAMAEILRETHRHGEVLMRYGGDEFVIFGAGYSEDAAREMIERIRKDIILYNENHPEKSYQLSASIGYHIEPYDTKATIEELISCADKKMYQEKKTKRRN
jgi:diguanylate cyclase (GGDEF)-like protein